MGSTVCTIENSGKFHELRDRDSAVILVCRSSVTWPRYITQVGNISDAKTSKLGFIKVLPNKTWFGMVTGSWREGQNFRADDTKANSEMWEHYSGRVGVNSAAKDVRGTNNVNSEIHAITTV